MERSMKNVLVVACGFLLLFTAYGGLQNLQSSLYSEHGLGVATLSILYGSVLLSSMFLPPILIKKCGCKWTIVGSMCCYVVFSLGNFHANWYTLIPTSILLGLGAAPLWSAQSTYLTVIGNLQAEKVGKLGKDVVNQYFGIFFLIFQSSGVWGNLISSLVFGKMSMQDAIPDEQLMSCGAKDCLMGPSATNTTHHPSQQLIYTLLGIYTSSGVLAILLVALFLEPVKDKLENEGETRSRPLWSTLLSTFMLFRDKRLCLLMFLPVYSGFQQGFLSGEYTKSYVTCALGIRFVGYVMICFSAMTALCSLLYGKISKHTGRITLYVLGAAIHFSCIVVFLLWHPNPVQLPVFFVLSGLWGMADAVWQTQNNGSCVGYYLALDVYVCVANIGMVTCLPWPSPIHLDTADVVIIFSFLFGVLFEENKEPAFANYRLGEAVGFVIAFGYSSFLCVSTKLYILLGVLSVAMVGYGTVEYREYKAACKVLAAEEKNQAEEEGTKM